MRLLCAGRMIAVMPHADAIAIRHARHARVRMIRRRVVTATVALFVATWLLITLMLVTGHDAALGHNASSSDSAASTSSGATSSSAGGAGGASSVAPSPVTSRQS
jgi:uncharacterized membrane protein YgcG